jgi:hypothetical protein
MPSTTKRHGERSVEGDERRVAKVSFSCQGLDRGRARNDVLYSLLVNSPQGMIAPTYANVAKKEGDTEQPQMSSKKGKEITIYSWSEPKDLPVLSRASRTSWNAESSVSNR